MALLEILRQRTAHKGRTAQVSCGNLGVLTVEALPVAECGRYKDDRALLYAACRELQSAGEALRREGSLFRPDEVLEYLTEHEAAIAASTIRALSGAAETEDPATETSPEIIPAVPAPPDEKAEPEPLPSSSVDEAPTALPVIREVSPADETQPALSPDSPVLSSFPRISSQQSTSASRQVIAEAQSGTPASPALKEAWATVADAPVSFHPAPRSVWQSPSTQEQESLAQAAAELLARELCRAALVR